MRGRPVALATVALALAAGGCRTAHAPSSPAPIGTPARSTDSAVARATGAPDTGRANNGRPRPSIDRATATRFEIVGVGDSTFTFLTSRAPWVANGAYGIVVDPRRRDALVARFTVLALRPDTATALITGQTNPLVTEHVALLSRPPEQPTTILQRTEKRRFWAGAAVGAAFGLIAGLLLH